jgi:beta-glucanase (GH16 family)
MKKNVFLIALIALLSTLMTAQPPSDAYKLVHFEDFNKDATNIGDEIAPDYPLDNGNITGTCSYPLKKNATISKGLLNLAVINEFTPHPTNPKAEPRNFSGAGWHLFSTFRYGYFEAKFKITKLDHIWGCFWLLKNTGLGRYQEVDIMEFFTASPKNRGYASASQHWWASTRSTKTKHWNRDFGDINLDSFHVYGCEWTPTTLRFFIDGVLKGTIKNYQLHDPMHIKLDMSRQFKQKKGDNAPCGLDTTRSILMADYVKVWQIPNTKSVYAKAQKNATKELTNLISIAKPQPHFANWDNMLHVAWYPQAKYTISSDSPNMTFREITWALGSDNGYNYRGELTKGFLYACNVGGNYRVNIKISFPELSDYEENVAFLVKIE